VVRVELIPVCAQTVNDRWTLPIWAAVPNYFPDVPAIATSARVDFLLTGSRLEGIASGYWTAFAKCRVA